MFVANWREAIANRRFTVYYIINLLVCYALYMYVVRVLVENRFAGGPVLRDMLQQHLTPRDFSIPIFALTYSCIIAYIIYVLPRPVYFYYAARAFLAVFLLRAFFIHLVPLSPPPGFLFLNDPFLDWIVGDNHEIMNDLFFSGHVADVCIFIFCCHHRGLKAYMVVSTIVVAVLITWQRVHYSADVIGAPFFAYGSYRLFAAGRLQQSIEEVVQKPWKNFLSAE